MNISDTIRHSLGEAEREISAFIQGSENIQDIQKAAECCAEAIRKGNKIICCGNGGSLCDASHFAEELTGRYRGSRRPLPAISINDSAYMTCTGNDFSFDEIFSRYVEGMGREGDVFLAISTSGKSKNILMAVESAHSLGLTVVGLTAHHSDGGEQNPLASMSDVAIMAPCAPHSDRIQEIHSIVIHILIECIEKLLGLDN